MFEGVKTEMSCNVGEEAGGKKNAWRIRGEVKKSRENTIKRKGDDRRFTKGLHWDWNYIYNTKKYTQTTLTVWVTYYRRKFNNQKEMMREKKKEKRI